MDNADYSKNPGESLSYLEEAQIQMKKRPKLSIVLRLTVAFLISFVISLGSALIIILTIHNVKNNYYFIETIHSYSLNLQPLFLLEVLERYPFYLGIPALML